MRFKAVMPPSGPREIRTHDGLNLNYVVLPTSSVTTAFLSLPSWGYVVKLTTRFHWESPTLRCRVWFGMCLVALYYCLFVLSTSRIGYAFSSVVWNTIEVFRNSQMSAWVEKALHSRHLSVHNFVCGSICSTRTAPNDMPQNIYF